MNRNFFLLAIMLMAFFTTSVLAAPPTTNAISYRNDGSWYFGGQLGQGYVHDDAFLMQLQQDETILGLRTKSNIGLSYNIYGGYLVKIARNWALGWQLAYQELGSSKDTQSLNIEGEGFSLAEKLNYQSLVMAMRVNYYFANDWSLSTSLGAAYLTRQRSFSVETAGIEVDAALPNVPTTTQLSMVSSLGLSYQLSKELSFSATYQHIFGDDTELRPTIDNYWLGLNYLLQPLSGIARHSSSKKRQGWHVGAETGMANNSFTAINVILANQASVGVAGSSSHPEAAVNGLDFGYQWAVSPNWSWGWQLGVNGLIKVQ
jgi:hypothetical protein